jgi:hypothetical protein
LQLPRASSRTPVPTDRDRFDASNVLVTDWSWSRQIPLAVELTRLDGRHKPEPRSSVASTYAAEDEKET